MKTGFFSNIKRSISNFSNKVRPIGDFVVRKGKEFYDSGGLNTLAKLAGSALALYGLKTASDSVNKSHGHGLTVSGWRALNRERGNIVNGDTYKTLTGQMPLKQGYAGTIPFGNTDMDFA